MNTTDITNDARAIADYMADDFELVDQDGEPIVPDERVSYSLLARIEARKYFGVEFAVADLREAFITDPRFAEIVDAMRPAFLVADAELTADSVFTTLEPIFDPELELTDVELDEAFDTVDIEDVKRFLGTIMTILEDCIKRAGDGYLDPVIEKATVIAYDNLRWKGVESWTNPDSYLSRYPSQVEALNAWAKANMRGAQHT